MINEQSSFPVSGLKPIPLRRLMRVLRVLPRRLRARWSAQSALAQHMDSEARKARQEFMMRNPHIYFGFWR